MQPIQEVPSKRYPGGHHQSRRISPSRTARGGGALPYSRTVKEMGCRSGQSERVSGFCCGVSRWRWKRKAAGAKLSRRLHHAGTAKTVSKQNQCIALVWFGLKKISRKGSAPP